MMLITIMLFIVSIFLIWKGSDWLTDSLIPVAHKLGTSYIAVTTLLASFMISIPEIFSSIYSLLLGHYNIGLGVIVGSVMMNIGICVGLSAAIKPLYLDKDVLVRDGAYLVIVAIIVMVLGSDLTYQQSDGVVLLLLFIPYALNVWYFEQSRENKREKVEQIKATLDLFGNQTFLNLKPSLLTFFLGALLLVFGSYMFSSALINLTEMLNMPEILVGFLFGAIGTGIPNIAAAVQGTLKGYKDVAITETFGSNIFTLLITLGIYLLFKPIDISAKIFYFDLTWMIFIHIMMLAFILKGYKYKEASLTRLEGIILMLFYFSLVFVNVFFFKG